MLPAVEEDRYSLSVLLREDMVEESCFAGAEISWSVSKVSSTLKLLLKPVTMVMGTFWMLSDLCLLVEGSVFTAEGAGASTSSGMSSSSPGLAISFRVHTFGILLIPFGPGVNGSNS
jgi:hypothetical protein